MNFSTKKTLPEIRNQAPLYFRMAKALQRNGIKGGYRLERLGREQGWADHICVRYELSTDVNLVVPIDDNRSYGKSDIVNYEADCIQFVIDKLENQSEAVTLIDCGADVGLISARFSASSPAIAHVIAIEPNSNIFPYLKHNIESLAIKGEAYNSAVSDYSGKAVLKRPSFGHTSHSAFIVPDQEGDIEVRSIDSLDLVDVKILLLKIDVEGEELAVIRGAHQTLKNAKNFVVIFEAHPLQTQRTGIDPMQVVAYLKTVQPCNVQITEEPDIPLRDGEPFWEQVPQQQIYNICVYTNNL